MVCWAEREGCVLTNYHLDVGEWTYNFQTVSHRISGVNDAKSHETVISDVTDFAFRQITANVDFSPSLKEGQKYVFNELFPVDTTFIHNATGWDKFIVDTNISVSTKYFDIYVNGSKITDDHFVIDMVFDQDGNFEVSSVHHYDPPQEDLVIPRFTVDDVKLAPKAAFFTENDQSNIFHPYVGGYPLIWARPTDDYFFTDGYDDDGTAELDLNYNIGASSSDALKITKLNLFDVTNLVDKKGKDNGPAPLNFLSIDGANDHFGGNTRIKGTITIKGEEDTKLDDLYLEIIQNGEVKSKATLASDKLNEMLLDHKFGSDKKISISTEQLLFKLSNEEAANIDVSHDGTLYCTS